MDKKVLDELLTKAGVKPGDQKVILPGQIPQDPMTQLTNFTNDLTQQLEAVISQMEMGISKIGQGLDLTRLQMFMMYKILVDKGICTEEEMKEYYKNEVSARLKEMQEEMLKKIQEQQNVQTSTNVSEIKSRG